MEDTTPGRRELVRFDVPLQRRGLYQHGARRGARLPHWQPVLRGRSAPARGLLAVAVLIDIRLRNAHLAPVAVELIGHHHGKRGLDALPDLGILGDDGNRAVGGDGDEG